jgi:hypothetical protein
MGKSTLLKMFKQVPNETTSGIFIAAHMSEYTGYIVTLVGS